MNRKRLLINGASSAGQCVILAVVMFLVYRVVLSNIGPERFGLWTLILSLSSLGQFASFGLTGSLVKFVAKNHALGNAHAVSRAIEVCLLATGGLLLVAFLIVWPIIEYFVPFLSNAKSNDSIRWMIAAAMTTTWLLALSGIVYAGLEGLQRYVLRNAVAIAASLTFGVLALTLTSRMGLAGLAAAHFTHQLLALTVAYVLLRRCVNLPTLPYRWNWAIFRELLSYGIRLQFASMAGALFDPVTKSLLSRFGGVTMVGYYEPASKLVTYLQRVILAICQVLVPMVAEYTETASHQIGKLYASTTSMVIFVATPTFTLLAVFSPAVSIFFLGSATPEFVQFVVLLTVGWFLNTLAAVAFIFRLGTGNLRWNTIGQVVIAFANVVLGMLFGSLFGAPGVVLAWASALSLGSLIGLYTFHTEVKTSTTVFRTAENVRLVASACVACVLATTVYRLDLLPTATSASMMGLISIFLMLPAMYGHSGWRRIESWAILLLRKRLVRV